MVSPRTVLFCPRVMACPAPVTMVGLVPEVAGRGSLPAGTVRPVMEARVAVAPWPIRRWLFSRVTPPV